jgi:hypothetical protein
MLTLVRLRTSPSPGFVALSIGLLFVSNKGLATKFENRTGAGFSIRTCIRSSWVYMAVAEPLATFMEFRLLGTNHLLEAYVCQTICVLPSRIQFFFLVKSTNHKWYRDKVAMV